MNKAQIIQRIREIGLMPVVRTDSADEAIRAAEAIKESGIYVIEITMTVPGALHVIEEVARRYSVNEVIIGGGTVLDAETARACILAGASFIVSPSTDLATIACCRKYGIASIPGALTPTEIVAAWTAGADVVKIFPANALGGANYLKTLKAPLPQIEMIPSGGVTLETASEFIKAGALALSVGADLVNMEAVRGGETEVIKEYARLYTSIVKEARTELNDSSSHRQN